MKLKKLVSLIFSFAVIGAIGFYAYTHPAFVKRQYNKAKGVVYVYKGDKAYKNLNMQKAIKYYNKALKLYPSHYGAWYNLGNIYVAYEDYYGALNAYSQAFKYNPKMMIARMNYGIIATEKLGDFDSSIDQYKKIIKTKRQLVSIPYVYSNKLSYKENKAIAYYNMGVTYRLKSLYETDNWELQRKYLAQAIINYKKSLDISPKRYDTLYNLGLAYQITGYLDDAQKYYCKAIAVAPLSYEAHYNLAVLLRRLKLYKESYEEIEKASTLIAALDENSAVQEYAAIVMNDIMQNVYNNEEYKSYMNSLLETEKTKLKTVKKSKKDGNEISSGVYLSNGKITTDESFEKDMFVTFGKCPVISK